MIYFDNASTAFPKAPGVARSVKEAIESGCFNINRGSYDGAWATQKMVFETRRRLAALFGFNDSRGVAFTSGVTQSINMLLKGLLKPGDRVVTTVMDHNAVLRPLRQLEHLGVRVEIAHCDASGALDLDDMSQKLKAGVQTVVMTHASNVCGAVQGIGEVGRLCRQFGAALIVDAAQTAGSLSIDMERDNIDALAFSGHKGLLATEGIGGFAVRDDMSRRITPLLAGGTGSFSDSPDMPDFMPDRFEAGTLNLPGIAALSAALDYIENRGVSDINAHARSLRRLFIEKTENIDGIRLIGPGLNEPSCSIVALDFIGRDNAEIAHEFFERYGIMTRSGLHCAPLMHKALGTFPQGAVRFSFGFANTLDEVETCADALRELL